jgi:hypothetical protein
VTIHLYRVKDTHGNHCEVSVNETSGTVHIYGLRSAAGHPVFFETEAYHLGAWVKDKGLTLERFEVQVSLDTMKVKLRRV